MKCILQTWNPCHFRAKICKKVTNLIWAHHCTEKIFHVETPMISWNIICENKICAHVCCTSKHPPKITLPQLVYHQWDEQHPTLIESQTHDINKINMNFVYQDNISSTASFMWNTNGFKGLWYIIWHLHVMKAQISLSEY